MSTIASPRPSVSIKSPASSVRTSLDVPAARPGPSSRRNRAALRDYYNIKGAEPVSPGKERVGESIQEEEISELDQSGFDAGAYVETILSTKSLEEVLRVEAGLVSEIRGLDGEKKALVYDNYSKLITATDTIRKMRTNMDPLTPATSTLQPAISHIAETAKNLSETMNERTPPTPRSSSIRGERDTTNQRQTVKWVLDSPRRFMSLLAAGKKEEAELQWAEVKHLLNTWEGVKGVDDVRRNCEDALQPSEDEDDDDEEEEDETSAEDED